MLKQLFTGGSALALVLAGSLLAPTKAQMASPSSPRPAQSPQAQLSSPSQATPQVSQDDLQKFVQALEQIHTIRQQRQTQMQQVLQQQGLSEERFTQISQARRQSAPHGNSTPQGNTSSPGSPANQLALDATPAELQHFEQATTQLTQIQQDTQNRMRQAVESQGLSPQQFNQILATVRQNPQLQQQVMSLLHR